MKKYLIFLLSMTLLLAFQTTRDLNASSLNLSQNEIDYINDHKVLTTGVDPMFVPFEFMDNGNYLGIASDYIKLIEERTGFTFEVVENLTWAQAYFKALEGEIDVLPALSKTSNRENFFLFSSMYYEIKRVIVTLNSDQKIKSLSDLEGKTVAVQINSSHHSFLLNYENINLSLYDEVDDALAAVSDGREVAFVGNLATSDYLIKSSGITNLRFSALPSNDPVGLHFAVQKDNLVLLSILNKALASITPDEKIAIHSKWVTVDTLETRDLGPLIQTLVILGSFILVAGLISSYWIVRLRREIIEKEKTRKDLEAAKKEAEAANLVKSTFMARMSHEIRTPLNAITGMSYLLKKTDVNFTQKMYLERITQASTNMLNLINDILDYSKIESSKIELEEITFSLDQVVFNLMSILAVKIEEKGLNFRYIKDPKLHTYYRGDPKRIEQVLLNLLNNAIKFTDKGDVIFEIHQKAIGEDKEHLILSVKDTGIGMNKEVMSQLFVPFKQADASINRRFGGSGLGLSIVKHLVELMGGSVSVYSKEFEGSTFVVELSLSYDQEKEASVLKESSNTFFKNIHALVLDKNTSNLNMMETYLHSFGIRSELTTSSVSAESLITQYNQKMTDSFDLLICDYETPSEKGLEFIRRLKENTAIKQFPKIILMIPMQRTDLFDQLNHEAIDAAIGKPVISSILHNTLLEVFLPKSLEKTKEKIQGEAIEKLNKTILIVDDNDTNQLISKLLLEQQGFDTLRADDGLEAVKLYQSKSADIDLILMDIHMPNLNGYDATKQILRMNKDALVIAMSAEIGPEVIKTTNEVGMVGYVSKPFDPEVLIHQIKQTLNKHNKPVVQKRLPINVNKGIKQLGENADLYTLVIKEYYKETSEVGIELSQAVTEKDYIKVRSILHKHRSSSASIGADQLYEIILKMHKSALEEDSNQLTQLLDEFNLVFKDTRDYIKKHYIIESAD
jgi:signal transduction histidine kinase/DNA-binding response OmpR family regulator